MLMLDQIPQLCEEFAASTTEEERVRVALKICDECVGVLRKRCDIGMDCYKVGGSEAAMQYYGVSIKAKAYANLVEKKDDDEYKASVVLFYADVLMKKSLFLVNYYRKAEKQQQE